MYSLEGVLTWEAEMVDNLEFNKEMLSKYHWMEWDLKRQRASLLTDESVDLDSIKQVDEALNALGETISKTKEEINEKEIELKKMFCCWKQYLKNK
ncbi:MAG TPA: hypothetical protein DDY49_06060 [Paenibacillaceae bacterium]|nr:hypothetical protein [Paenibacillaceae bacterium]